MYNEKSMDYLKNPKRYAGIDDYRMVSGVADLIYFNKKRVKCYFNLYGEALELESDTYPVMFDINSLCRAIGTKYHMKDNGQWISDIGGNTWYGSTTDMYKNIKKAYKAHKTNVSPQRFKTWFKDYVIPMYNRDTNWNTYAKSDDSIKKIWNKLRDMK